MSESAARLRTGHLVARLSPAMAPTGDTNPETGLTSAEVAELQKQWGLNHVAAKTTPEWKKILDRYLDWVSLIIVSSCASVCRVMLGEGRWLGETAYGNDAAPFEPRGGARQARQLS